MHFPFTYTTNSYKRSIHGIDQNDLHNKTTIIYVSQEKPFQINATLRFIKTNEKKRLFIQTNYQNYTQFLNANLKENSRIFQLINDKKYISIVNEIMQDLKNLCINGIDNLQMSKIENHRFIKDNDIYIQTSIGEENDLYASFKLTSKGDLEIKVLQNEICETYDSPNGIIYEVPAWKNFDTIYNYDLYDYEKIKHAIESENTFLIDSTVKKWFDDYINYQLEDPFIDDDYINQNHNESYWAQGSENNLISLIKDIIYSEPNIKEVTDWPLIIHISSQTEENRQDISIYQSKLLNQSERIKKLFWQATEENILVGWNCEYNDGSIDRESGYSKYSEVIRLELEKPSSHEIMDSYIKINKWLENQYLKEEIDNIK